MDEGRGNDRAPRLFQGFFRFQLAQQRLGAGDQLFLARAQRVAGFAVDGEFDGCGLLRDITEAGWYYVCRTAKSALLAEADWPSETFSPCDLGLTPGDCVELPDLLFTAQGLGPVLVGAVWEAGQKEPLLLVTNLDFLHDARTSCMTPASGTGDGSASRPSFRTRKAGAFTCATAI